MHTSYKYLRTVHTSATFWNAIVSMHGWYSTFYRVWYLKEHASYTWHCISISIYPLHLLTITKPVLTKATHLTFTDHSNTYYLLCLGKRERIDFAQTITKYDRRFKVRMTWLNLFLPLLTTFCLFCLLFSNSLDSKTRPSVVSTICLPCWQGKGMWYVWSVCTLQYSFIHFHWIAHIDQKGSNEGPVVGGDQEKDPYRQNIRMFT